MKEDEIMELYFAAAARQARQRRLQDPQFDALCKDFVTLHSIMAGVPNSGVVDHRFLADLSESFAELYREILSELSPKAPPKQDRSM